MDRAVIIRHRKNLILRSTACSWLVLTFFCLQSSIAADRNSVEFSQKYQAASKLAGAQHWAAARPLLIELSQNKLANQNVFSLLAESYMIDIQGNDRDLKMAEIALDKALAIAPEWGAAWRQKCTLAVRQERYNEAIAYANKALTCKQPDRTVYYQRAKAYAALNDYKQALADVNEQLKVDPFQTRANRIIPGNLLLKLNLLEQLGRYDEAIALYRQLQKEGYNGTSLNIVRCLQRANRLPEAIDEVSRLIDKNPKDDQAFYQRAELKRKGKDLTGALKDYTRAIELSPLSRYYLERSKVYDALHKTAEAEADRLKAKSDEF